MNFDYNSRGSSNNNSKTIEYQKQR